MYLVLSHAILVNLLASSNEQKNNVKNIQLVQRCIWKLVKSMPESDTIRADELISHIATFLDHHPPKPAVVPGSEDEDVR